MATSDSEHERFDSSDRSEDIDKLNDFLVHNDELEELSARVATFNLFSVLRIERTEIRHSNVLAWLLSPTETHGLGDAFLRRFLSRLLILHDFPAIGLSPAEVELMDLDDVEVRREWLNIDIAVTFGRETSTWVLLIENKVGSTESPDQLARYWESLRAERGDARLLPVLLSLDGDEPSDAAQALGYVPVSYTEVLEIVERVYQRYRKRVPEGACVLIEHYIETLRRLTMQDPQLVKLCKDIYRKHKEAIDLIVAYGASSQVLDVCEEEINALVKPRHIVRTKNFVFFVPPEFPDWQVDEMQGWKFLGVKYPVVWWFQHHREAGKLHVAMEVGPVTDADLRDMILRRLKDAGLSVPAWAFTDVTKKRYTRVVSLKKPLPRDAAEDGSAFAAGVRDLTRSLWRQAWERGAVAVPVLEGFAAEVRRSKSR